MNIDSKSVDKNQIWIRSGDKAILNEFNPETTQTAMGSKNLHTEIFLEKGASLKRLRFSSPKGDCQQTLVTHVHVAEGARFEDTLICLGSTLNRHEIYLDLEGENAVADLGGMVFVGSDQKAQVVVKVNHQVGETTSSQLYKNLVSANGRSYFEGKVKVAPKAKGTQAQQLNKNLLIGKEARAYSRPELEIDHDEVKCSHGATFTRLSDEQRFYLQSRGITPAAADIMLARAFSLSFLDRITDGSLKEQAQKHIEQACSSLLEDSPSGL